MTIRIAQTEADLRVCLPALLCLRPQLEAEAVLASLQDQQANERFSVAFVDGGDAPAPAVITYRQLTLLVSGKTIYIDDLTTLPEARGNGYAGALLDFVIEQARQLGCKTVSLDSGHGPDRADAHRLYLNKRFRISSHHFSLSL
ncbi:GNAT family N-acetyltransferase [Rudanella lutea]|uniref:GNAT family N-acetyltransferase n=1 Tax=Rudanella lutea TaxID=451374 RepID=UPI000362152E|nr:GNAT family N-acetyltransferase [Rudanella lutea]